MTALEIKDCVEEKFGVNNPRYIHIIGVYHLATILAKRYNVSVEKAQIAALLHDYCKNESLDSMRKLIHNDRVFNKNQGYPFLYHAYASAQVAIDTFGIEDEDIILAIKNHVIGRHNMTLLEEIIFIADYCEDSREYESCKKVRKILDKSLYEAIYNCYTLSIDYLESRGLVPHKLQYELKEVYKKKGNEL